MKKHILIILMLCVFWSESLSATDLNVLDLDSSAPIELSADSIEYQSDTNAYMITGNAFLKSGDSTIGADEITVDIADKKARASGNVVLTDADGTISADRIDVNLGDSSGIIVHGRIFVRSENFHITGESLERLDEKRYIVKNGTFTTCDGEVPGWKFSASQIDIEIDGYAFAVAPKFYLRDMPLLYLPAVVFPIKQTRQSGLLFPDLGYATDDGAKLKLPYYHVISESMDATVALDYQSKRGIGADTEFRYFLRENSWGNANWHLMDEFDYADNRWRFSFNHQEYFTPTLSLKADLTGISDRNYFLDFGRTAGEINKEKVESNITLTKSFKSAAIQLEYSYDEDLKYDSEALNPPATNRQFPKATATLYKSRVFGTPLYLSGTAVYNSFSQSAMNDFTYLKAEPALSADIILGRYATISPQIKGINAKFWLPDDDSRDYDTYDSYDASVNISTQLLRVFDAGDSLKVKHLLNPQIEYSYSPRQEVYEDYYALADIEGEKNTVSLKLINRVNARRGVNGAFEYSEPLRLEIRQDYDIYEATRELSGAGDKREPLKPLFIDADINITDYFAANTELYYDYYYIDRLREYNASVSVRDSRSDHLSLSYNHLKDVNNYLQSDMNLSLWYGISLGSTLRYDFIDHDFLETVCSVNLAMQCWSMNIRYSEDDVDRKVLLYFSMKGIGETKEIAIFAD